MSFLFFSVGLFFFLWSIAAVAKRKRKMPRPTIECPRFFVPSLLLWKSKDVMSRMEEGKRGKSREKRLAEERHCIDSIATCSAGKPDARRSLPLSLDARVRSPRALFASSLTFFSTSFPPVLLFPALDSPRLA